MWRNGNAPPTAFATADRLFPLLPRIITLVIPGWSEGPDPESRDSPMCNCTSEVRAEPVIGRAFAARWRGPGMTMMVGRNAVELARPERRSRRGEKFSCPAFVL